MKSWIFSLLFTALFAITPLALSIIQHVPTRSGYQLTVALLSQLAFGLLLGLFWLTRLLPHTGIKLRLSSTLRWHKWIGYLAGTFLLIHPVLMIARRFRVEESNPIDNFWRMVQSPLMMPGIIAWFLLLSIVLLSITRKHFPVKPWRLLHGLLSILFTSLATWHVISIGRHSSPTLDAFWLILAISAIGTLLITYLPTRTQSTHQENNV